MAWKRTRREYIFPLALAFLAIVCVLEMMGTGPFGAVRGSGGSHDFTSQVNVDEDFTFILAEHVDEGDLPAWYEWRLIYGDGQVSDWLDMNATRRDYSYDHYGMYTVYLEVRDVSLLPGGGATAGADGADGAADGSAGGDGTAEDVGEYGPGVVIHKEVETLRVLAKVDPLMRNITIFVFIAAYVGIVTEKVDRTIVAMAGATFMVVLGVFQDGNIGQYISWETLGLIFGMFTMVTVLAESGFFRWIGLHTLRRTKFMPIRVFILFSAMGAFLSAFMDSITVLLFMATLTIEVCKIMNINPIPFLIAEITSANIGGSSTMVGDPPNIIIGTGLGYSFMDFVYHTGPIAVVVFFANLGFFLVWYRAKLKPEEGSLEKIRKSHMDLEPSSAIVDPYMMWTSLGVFIFAVGLLVVHDAFGISVALIGMFGASLTLLLAGRSKMGTMIGKIDWGTLLFFAGLFVLVGGLEATGVLRDIAYWIADVSGDNTWILLLLLLWMSAFLSAFIDNVPFAATMVPVIRELSNQGFTQHQMAYTVALGADIGGNGTPIGASANVVGLSVARRNGVNISWGEYMRVGMPAMVFSVFLCMILIFIAVETGWW
jgi:Na+/H+ antiporter NhaD/arsenite permease-like protein